MPVQQPVTSPTTVSRNLLIAVLEDEFAAEGYPVYADRLHRSLGRDKTVIGVSPVQEIPWNNDKNVLRMAMLVQFYGRWKDDIDPTTRIDPTTVETFAERFRRALKGNDPDTDQVWYFNLTEISYPHDPTGNVTRFEAKVEAIGNNSALILETV